MQLLLEITTILIFHYQLRQVHCLNVLFTSKQKNKKKKTANKMADDVRIQAVAYLTNSNKNKMTIFRDSRAAISL